MSNKRHILSAIITILLSQLFTSVFGQENLKNISLKKCPSFKDTRSIQTNENLITIPATRTSVIAYNASLISSNYSITFELTTHSKSEYILKCRLKSTELKILAWNLTEDESRELEPRNYNKVSSVATDRHPYSYFTNAGYFYDEHSGNYYDSEKYCVQS